MKLHFKKSAPDPGTAAPTKRLAPPTLNRIVVPVDFSELSVSGIDAAVHLLKNNPRACLQLVHVVEPLPANEFLDTGIAGNLLELEKSAGRDLEELRAKYAGEMEISTRIFTCEASSGIVRAAVEFQADLIVIPSHGRSGLGRALLGSVAEGVVHDAACPVLVAKLWTDSARTIIPNLDKGPPRKILVGFDHQLGGIAALAMARVIARQSGAAITLFHSLEIPDALSLKRILRAEEDVAELRQEAESRLENVRNAFMPESAHWAIRTRFGVSWEALAEQAREIGSDLVIIGAHEGGRHAVGMIGTTAKKLIRLSPCSVLTVR